MERKRVIVAVIAAVALLVVIGVFKSRVPAEQKATSSASPPSGWKIETGHDPMTDRQTVDASIEADNDIQGWLQATRPTLHVTCDGEKSQVYVWTGTAASVEEDYDGELSADHKVIIRFDGNESFGEGWIESDDHNALFEAHFSLEGTDPTQRLIVQMVQAKRLLFEFTPFNANPVIAHFDLQGLGQYIDEITKPCGWTVE
jgi:hypothetical protein